MIVVVEVHIQLALFLLLLVAFFPATSSLQYPWPHSWPWEKCLELIQAEKVRVRMVGLDKILDFDSVQSFRAVIEMLETSSSTSGPNETGNPKETRKPNETGRLGTTGRPSVVGRPANNEVKYANDEKILTKTKNVEPASVQNDGQIDNDVSPEEPDDPELDGFEECLGFFSHRRHLLQQEDELLETGREPDMIKVNHHFVNYDVLSTVLNPHLEVIIEGSIFKFINRGLAVEITDGSVETLEKLRKLQDCELPGLNEAIEEATAMEETEDVAMSGRLVDRVIDHIRHKLSCTDHLHFHLTHDGNGRPPSQGQNRGSCGASFTVTSDGSFGFTFNNMSDGTAPMTYNWDFGDGNNAITASPTHTFSSAGTYWVQLTITDADGCIDSVSKPVGIDDCTADFTWDANGGTVSFNNKASGGSTYSWEFGDPSGPSSTENPQHFYTSTGAYEVCLTVTNDSGCSAEACQDVVVNVANCCKKQSRDKEKDLTYGNDRRIKAKISQVNVGFLFIHKVKAKTINYRKKNNGKWKRDKADKIGAGVSGTVYGEDADGNDCAEDLAVNSYFEDSNNKKKKTKVTFTGTVWTRPGSVKSVHFAQDNGGQIEYHLSLHDKNC